MKNYESQRQVTYVKLHGGDAFVPGIGGLGTTLPPTGKSLELRMYHGSEGVEMVINNKIETLIPWANIQIVVYAYSPNSPAGASAASSSYSTAAVRSV